MDSNSNNDNSGVDDKVEDAVFDALIEREKELSPEVCGAYHRTMFVGTETADQLIKEFPDVFQMAKTTEKYGK